MYNLLLDLNLGKIENKILTIFIILSLVVFFIVFAIFIFMDYKNTKSMDLRRMLYKNIQKTPKFDVTTVYTDKAKNFSGTEILPEPSKPATKQYTYIFAGWDKNHFNESGDTVAKAVFIKKLNSCIVNFYLDDKSTLLRSVEVKYGEGVDVSDLLPTKDDSIEYTYKFLGWSKDISKIEDDENVYAVFESCPKAGKLELNETEFEKGTILKEKVNDESDNIETEQTNANTQDITDIQADTEKVETSLINETFNDDEASLSNEVSSEKDNDLKTEDVNVNLTDEATQSGEICLNSDDVNLDEKSQTIENKEKDVVENLELINGEDKEKVENNIEIVNDIDENKSSLAKNETQISTNFSNFNNKINNNLENLHQNVEDEEKNQDDFSEKNEDNLQNKKINDDVFEKENNFESDHYVEEKDKTVIEEKIEADEEFPSEFNLNNYRSENHIKQDKVIEIPEKKKDIDNDNSGIQKFFNKQKTQTITKKKDGVVIELNVGEQPVKNRLKKDSFEEIDEAKKKMNSRMMFQQNFGLNSINHIQNNQNNLKSTKQEEQNKEDGEYMKKISVLATQRKTEIARNTKSPAQFYNAVQMNTGKYGSNISKTQNGKLETMQINNNTKKTQSKNYTPKNKFSSININFITNNNENNKSENQSNNSLDNSNADSGDKNDI